MLAKIPIHQATATLLFVVALGAFAALAAFYPQAYVFATYEDLIGEWVQTFGFVVALFFSLRLALGRGPYRWFFALLALACFYTVMEEISWGQRLFGFGTPTILKEHNLQGEANLHNLFTGPVATTTKTVIEYLMAAGFVGYGLLYPLAAVLGWRPARWLDRIGVPAPPLYLWPYFVTAAALQLGPLNFNEAEISELLVALAIALFAAHYWIVRDVPATEFAGAVSTRAASMQLARVMLGAVLTIGALASATTYAVYNSARMRPAIDARLLNGYEKFAVRYGAYDRWDIAAQLYLLVHRQDPDSAYYLRRIADAFQRAGNETLFGIYNQKALDTSIRKFAARPDSISANLSLARSYLQRGETERAGFHAHRAHDIAQERAKRNPASANDAYWLAKTYRQIGDYPSALREYRRATELSPASSKYRRAYLEMLQYTSAH